MKHWVIIMFATVVLGSCSKSRLVPGEYVNWVKNPENGLVASKKMGAFEFSLLYKPVEYIALMEARGHSVSKEDVNKRKQELDGMQYYTLKIATTKDNEIMKTGITSEYEYYQRLEYFISPAQDDISIVEGKDTLPCQLYHFERNYGVAPYSTIVLGFPKSGETGEKNDKLFIYNDRVLGTGPVMLAIRQSDIDNVPELITQ